MTSFANDSKIVIAAAEVRHAEDDSNSGGGSPAAPAIDPQVVEEQTRPGLFAYFRTKNFWIVLALGQVLALCITGTNTLSSLLAGKGTSIPALQSLLTYVILNLAYTGTTLYKYGPRKWARLVVRDGWRYFVLAFFDVQGNYFTVLAYRYTTILSAQLINFWAIVVVVAVSFTFLRVRYRPTQYAGILVCIGGTGVLIASDHLTGANGGAAPSEVKGDMFALVGASCYGLANVLEEFLVSKRPLFEVVGQLAFWATPIVGVQAAIFDRAQFAAAAWDGQVGGYLAGFALVLALFYSLAPLLLRMASAAFFNVSLLTASFWGVLVGLRVFGLSVHWMYPLAFACIVAGLFVYFAAGSALADAHKPWLGQAQEGGVRGLGTARRRLETGDAV